jgi:hypothetical protein
VVVAVVLEGVLLYFDLSVTSDGLMQGVIKSIPRAPLHPVQELFFFLWKFLAMGIERRFGMIGVGFMPEIRAGFANPLYHF